MYRLVSALALRQWTAVAVLQVIIINQSSSHHQHPAFPLHGRSRHGLVISVTTRSDWTSLLISANAACTPAACGEKP